MNNFWFPEGHSVGAPMLPALPQWIGPDAKGQWGHPMAPRVLWRMHAFPVGQPYGEYGYIWAWQWWSKKLKAWVNRFHWAAGQWWPTPLGAAARASGAAPSPEAKLGPIPPPIYPPIVPPPQLAPPPIW